MDNETETLRKFWDGCYSGYDGMKIPKEECLFGGDLDAAIKLIGDNCNSVVDYGCGTGAMAFACAYYGEKVKSVIGIDVSASGIKFAEDSARLSDINCDKLRFIVGDLSDFLALPYDIDGIICSNVLDVIPEVEADRIIQAFYSRIKTGGYLMIKVNFFLESEFAKRAGMVEGEKNYFYKDGVLRSHNLDTKTWLDKFSKFTFIKEYAFKRAETIPADRIFIFQKQ